MEETTFKLKDYHAFLAQNAESIETFRTQQRAAFGEERERWAAAGQNLIDEESAPVAAASEIALPENGRFISAPLPGSVWQVAVKEGDLVKTGDKVFILESMKMETAITAPVSGRIEKILVAPGKTVEAGQPLVVIVED